MIIPQPEHQKSWLNRVNSTWGFGLAFSLGVEDGFNINSLSVAMLFFIFLVYVVRSPKNIIFSGLLCMTLQLMVLTSMVHGNFDILLSRESVYQYVKILCGLLGLIFLMIGFFYFRDWWQLRIGGGRQKQWIHLPTPLETNEKSEGLLIVKFFISLFYWVLAMLFGAVIVLISSYAVQDYTMFIMLLDSVSQEKINFGEQAVMIYGLAYLIPTSVLCIMAGLYSFNGGFRKYVERSLSIVKIILSAVFFSFGIGLMITFYAM
ncbi:MAG: hypothetical protein AB7S78_04485 [Candidatus Omnitrophota bacterium]